MTLTIITPYVEAHAELMERARASVLAQSIPCEFIPIFDKHLRGVAWARNEGVKLTQTSHVGFLDADDVLMPDYAEKMLAGWQAGFYTYCDYYYGSQREHRQTQECFSSTWGRRHTVSCVMSVVDFKRVGGFDETYRKAEDVEFWFRCHARGVRGIRVPYPLMHYTDDKPVKRNMDTHLVGHYINEIYGRYPSVTAMGCCGDSEDLSGIVIGNKQQDTDILVKMNWSGNRKHMGSVTGRVYPRNGNGKKGWIDPRDQAAQPDLYLLLPASLPVVDSEDTAEILDSFQEETQKPVSSKKSRNKKDV